MRWSTIMTCTALSIFCFGCENRTPQLVASSMAPGGRHALWVMNEAGGLRSGVVSIHMTRTGGKPTAQNSVLQTPDCTGAEVGWQDADNILIVYDDMYAGSFHSNLRTGGPRVLLVERRSAIKQSVRLASGIPLPCDPL